MEKNSVSLAHLNNQLVIRIRRIINYGKQDLRNCRQR